MTSEKKNKFVEWLVKTPNIVSLSLGLFINLILLLYALSPWPGNKLAPFLILIILYFNLVILYLQANVKRVWALEAERTRSAQTLEKALEAERTRSAQTLEAERTRSAQTLEKALEAERTRSAQALEKALETERTRSAQALEKALETAQNRWTTAIKTEKSERIASFARRDSTGKIPTHCLILLAVHRSGSTWLMDALRTHPQIYLEPRAIIFEHLRLIGSRYPYGLSNSPDATIDLELQPGLGAKVPVLGSTQQPGPIWLQIQPDAYAIEKIHPEYFGYDVNRFQNDVNQLECEPGVVMKFIYHVRDPKAAITSFLNYQRRDETWYKNTTQAEVPTLIRREFETIQEMSQHRTGLVINYTDLVTNFQQTMVSIYKFLWSEIADSTLPELASAAQAATVRDKRTQQNQSTTFLGSEIGPMQGGGPEYTEFFEQYTDDIEACYKAYQALTSSK
jgi:hypothetical protein